MGAGGSHFVETPASGACLLGIGSGPAGLVRAVGPNHLLACSLRLFFSMQWSSSFGLLSTVVSTPTRPAMQLLAQMVHCRGRCANGPLDGSTTRLLTIDMGMSRAHGVAVAGWQRQEEVTNQPHAIRCPDPSVSITRVETCDESHTAAARSRGQDRSPHTSQPKRVGSQSVRPSARLSAHIRTRPRPRVGGGRRRRAGPRHGMEPNLLSHTTPVRRITQGILGPRRRHATRTDIGGT